MAVTKMGFEGKAYYGVAGAEAMTEITNSIDITETFGTGQGETTVRGLGTVAPLTTKRITERTYSLTINMREKTSDTTLTALKAAAATGDPVAIRTKSHSAGTGVDGDMVITGVTNGKPLKGEATLDFTFEPNDDNRAFQLNV